MCPHCGQVIAVGNQATVKLDPPELPPTASVEAAQEQLVTPPPLPPPPEPKRPVWPWIVGAVVGLGVLLLLVDYVRLRLSPPSPVAVATPEAPGERAATAPVYWPQEQAPAVEPAPAVVKSPTPAPEPPPVVATLRRDDSAIAALRPAVPRNVAQPLTDAQIGQSIQKGVDALIALLPDVRKRAKGTAPAGVESPDAPQDWRDIAEGAVALDAYALLHTGQAIDDERLTIRSPTIKDLLLELKGYRMIGTKATYSRSLRIAALAVHNRIDDRRVIEDDSDWLVRNRLRYEESLLRQGDARATVAHGAYGYGRAPFPARPTQWWDNSNSQYGTLGVWLADDAGATAPAQYWKDVANHWMACQLPSGGWNYNQQRGSAPPTLAMTVGGAMVLFVAREKLSYRPDDLKDLQPRLDEALDKALQWLDEGDNAIGARSGYGLYGIERLGLASGIRFFGTHDWYTELATRVIRNQKADGSWGRAGERHIETAFHLLFLSRGRHPSFIAKLRVDENRTAFGRDVANLAKFASRQLERPLNYQVASLNRAWLDWTDSPALFISADKPLDLQPRDIRKLQEFANGGGMLFTHAEGGSERFNESIQSLAKSLFPQYALQALPADHPIYSVVFPLRDRTPLQAVSNGSRLLLVHSPTDVATTWQRGNERAGREAFELGVNVVMYAMGKREFRNRLDESRVPAPVDSPKGQMPIARVRYSGNWDPEPLAWQQMNAIFQNRTSIAVDVQVQEMKELGKESPPFAHLTGTEACQFSQAEVEALREYLETGGMLLVEGCGGSQAFVDSVRTGLLLKAFAEASITSVSRRHGVLAGGWPLAEDLNRPAPRVFRMYTMESFPNGDPPPLEMLKAGDGVVFISHMDISSGLLGTRSWGIAGYTPSYAQSLVSNMLLWRIRWAQEQYRKPAGGSGR